MVELENATLCVWCSNPALFILVTMATPTIRRHPLAQRKSIQIQRQPSYLQYGFRPLMRPLFILYPRVSCDVWYLQRWILECWMHSQAQTVVLVYIELELWVRLHGLLPLRLLASCASPRASALFVSSRRLCRFRISWGPWCSVSLATWHSVAYDSSQSVPCWVQSWCVP